MTDRVGAPGTGIARREFVAASGGLGAATLAGCTAPSESGRDAPRAALGEGLPQTGPPEVVQVDEQGGAVTLRTQHARHAAHPLDTMGGPVELLRVWAFQADDRTPSVPGPVLRTTEGNDMEVTLDNTDGQMPHPMHVHNHRFQLVERDGGQIPGAARHDRDITDLAPAERHTVEFEADADPGIYLMHCHKVNHAMNGTFYPGGMVGGVVYEEAMDTAVFADLMEYAGYQG